MADVKDYNKAAADYQKRLQDPNWQVGKKKDLEKFSKGSQESGNKEVETGISNLKNRAKKAWGALVD